MCDTAVYAADACASHGLMRLWYRCDDWVGASPLTRGGGSEHRTRRVNLLEEGAYEAAPAGNSRRIRKPLDNDFLYYAQAGSTGVYICICICVWNININNRHSWMFLAQAASFLVDVPRTCLVTYMHFMEFWFSLTESEPYIHVQALSWTLIQQLESNATVASRWCQSFSVVMSCVADVLPCSMSHQPCNSHYICQPCHAWWLPL